MDLNLCIIDFSDFLHSAVIISNISFYSSLLISLNMSTAPNIDIMGSNIITFSSNTDILILLNYRNSVIMISFLTSLLYN